MIMLVHTRESCNVICRLNFHAFQCFTHFTPNHVATGTRINCGPVCVAVIHVCMLESIPNFTDNVQAFVTVPVNCYHLKWMKETLHLVVLPAMQPYS